MARPKKEGMDYFPHDTDAANDEKIEALRMLYGNDGYAFYFILLERIYRSKDFEIDVSDAETIQILAKKVDVTIEKFNSMLETSVKRGCFDQEMYQKSSILTSEGIKKRASVVVKKRVDMRNKYSEEVSDAETIPETPQRKEKKTKEKDNNSVHLFDQFWSKYPKKVGLAKAKKKFPKLLEEHGFDLIMKGLEGYLNEIKKNNTEKQYIKNGDTFLNQESFLDFLQTETPKPDEEGEYSPYKDWGIF